MTEVSEPIPLSAMPAGLLQVAGMDFQLTRRYQNFPSFEVPRLTMPLSPRGYRISDAGRYAAGTPHRAAETWQVGIFRPIQDHSHLPSCGVTNGVDLSKIQAPRAYFCSGQGPCNTEPLKVSSKLGAAEETLVKESFCTLWKVMVARALELLARLRHAAPETTTQLWKIRFGLALDWYWTKLWLR
jgi:hypothetical protein